jgi:hypothetical protein
MKASFLSESERAIKKVVRSGDFDQGFQIIDELYERADSFSRVIGIGLDIMEAAWDEEKQGQSFLDATVMKTRLNRITVRNHIKVRKFLSSGKVPEVYLGQVSELGQKSLIRISNTVLGGWQIEDDDWESIATSVSDKQVDAFCRKIEGKPPRSNFVGLYHGNGVITAFIKGRYVDIYAVLNPKDADAMKAREILHARAGVLEKAEN